MNKVEVPQPKINAYFIVRDLNGIPRFDEPETVPEPVKASLTDDELRKMNPETVERLGLSHRIT